MAKPTQHVVRHGDEWAVRKSGSERVTETFATQRQAIDRGTEIAKNQKTELFIHGRDGQIRERNSHGSDPFPPKG
jgi:uncharacterized protein YdaT